MDVALPVTHKEIPKITFHKINSLSELKVGEYGIPEPAPSAPEIKGGEKTICIVPALAYDKDGNRLGYGGGYYDRFLSTYKGISILAIYSFLYTDSLPTDEYDMAVHRIITEKGGVFKRER